MDEIEITISNWKKYNDRNDLKKHWWFKVHNELWRSAEFSLLTPEEKVCWYSILALCSKEQKESLKFNAAWFSAINAIDKKAVFSCIKKCLEFKWVTTTRTESVQIMFENCSPDKNRLDQSRIDLRSSSYKDLTKYKDLAKNKVCVAVKNTAPPDGGFPIENFVLNIPKESRDRIEKIYPNQEFVVREVEKMKIWLLANQRKMPKSKSGWTRFVMGWLERGWERHRKTINSEKANTSDKSWFDIYQERYGTKNEHGHGAIQCSNPKT